MNTITSASWIHAIRRARLRRSARRTANLLANLSRRSLGVGGTLSLQAAPGHIDSQKGFCGRSEASPAVGLQGNLYRGVEQKNADNTPGVDGLAASDTCSARAATFER